MINNIVKRSFHRIDSHKIETDKLSVLPSFFVHDEVKKHPTSSFACCWPLTAPMTWVKTITEFTFTYCPTVIHCVSMEFKLYESLKR